MKPFSPFICLFLSITVLAQHNPQEIKQPKINKILMNSASSDSKTAEKYDTRYDKNGNETAVILMVSSSQNILVSIMKQESW